MGPTSLIAVSSLLLSFVISSSAQTPGAYGSSGPASGQGPSRPAVRGYGTLPVYHELDDLEADVLQYLGARRLLAPVSSRTLLQAYNVQQFDAETIGLKYSEGDRRRLLDAGAPGSPASSRGLLQAYSVQQFDAETIGMKHSEGNRRRLLSRATSRSLLQAYNVQQFDAETIGLKYSEGDRRRLLGTDAPAASTYRTVTLGGYGGPMSQDPTEDIGSAVMILPTEGMYGSSDRLPGTYGYGQPPMLAAYGRF